MRYLEEMERNEERKRRIEELEEFVRSKETEIANKNRRIEELTELAA